MIGTELFPIAAHTHTSNWNCVNVNDCGWFSGLLHIHTFFLKSPNNSKRCQKLNKHRNYKLDNYFCDLFKNQWYQKTFVQWKDDLAVAFAICVVYCKIKVTEWAETPIRKFIWLIRYLPVPKIVFWKHCCTQLMLNRHTSLIMLHNLKISPNLFKFLITSTLK